MRRLVTGASVAVAAAGLLIGTPGSAVAQAPPLEVVSARFLNADGDEPIGFIFGEPIRAFIEVSATGGETVTGISATMSDPRSVIDTGTATWPDVAPGVPASNLDPFEFRHATPDPDAECMVFLNEGSVAPDEEIVTDPVVDQAVPTDPDADPSDPFEPIPSGGIVFTFTTDQGTFEYRHLYAAVCAKSLAGNPGYGPAAEAGGEVRGRLAATGPEHLPIVSLIGSLLIAVGLWLRAARPALR